MICLPGQSSHDAQQVYAGQERVRWASQGLTPRSRVPAARKMTVAARLELMPAISMPLQTDGEAKGVLTPNPHLPPHNRSALLTVTPLNDLPSKGREAITTLTPSLEMPPHNRSAIESLTPKAAVPSTNREAKGVLTPNPSVPPKTVRCGLVEIDAQGCRAAPYKGK